MKNKVRGRFGHFFKFLLLVLILMGWIYFYLSSFHPRVHGKRSRNISTDYDDEIYEYDLSFFGLDSDDDDVDIKEPIEIDLNYKKYIKELGLVNPGENGEPVILPANISAEIKQKVDEGYERHGFNSFVSNLISLNRKVPDPRAEICRQKTYENLPKASIVITLYNEEWTLLMRTIHSIVNRSPSELIEEIVLSDDASDRPEMLGQLDDYVAKHPKIRIIRSPVRHGVMQTRMLGAINAKGPVIIFVDSHVEVMYGWLEPLLDRFVHQDNVLATIYNMRIQGDTLKFDTYNIPKPVHFGGFAWSLDFLGTFRWRNSLNCFAKNLFQVLALMDTRKIILCQFGIQSQFQQFMDPHMRFEKIFL